MDLLCFLVVFSDVSVLVESKHLRMRYDWEGSDVVYVRLELAVNWSKISTTRREPEREETRNKTMTSYC